MLFSRATVRLTVTSSDSGGGSESRSSPGLVTLSLSLFTHDISSAPSIQVHFPNVSALHAPRWLGM